MSEVEKYKIVDISSKRITNATAIGIPAYKCSKCLIFNTLPPPTI